MIGIHYDRAGKKIDFPTYFRLTGDPEYIRVAVTKLEGVSISTVWLGLDHGLVFFGMGSLKIFETIVFGGRKPLEVVRYSTEEEAFAGHEATVEKWRGRMKVSNHSICLPCWRAKNPDREPIRLREAPHEVCCYCGSATVEGIYVRELYDPAILKCIGAHR